MWPQIGIMGGSALLNALMSEDSMSPEQRYIYNQLKGRLGVARNVQGQIDATTQGFKQQANQINASEDASMARRGMPVSPGQTALAHADTNASFGTALSKAIPQIQKNAKDEELQLLTAMSGVAPQPEGNGDFLNALSGFGQNLAYSMTKPQTTGGDFLNYLPKPKVQSPRLSQDISINQRQGANPYGGWYRDPFTGEWKRS